MHPTTSLQDFKEDMRKWLDSLTELPPDVLGMEVGAIRLWLHKRHALLSFEGKVIACSSNRSSDVNDGWGERAGA